MPTKIISAAINGLEATLIEVEVDTSPGLHTFSIVGLPDKAVEESRERITAAIKNIDCLPPHRKNQRIIINLAPADIKKEGPAYDLAIAIGYLHASDQLKFDQKNKLFLGELALDGKIRPINGVLPATIAAKKSGIKTIFIPKQNSKEASLIKEIEIIGVENLKELINHLEEKEIIQPIDNSKNNLIFREKNPEIDMAQIKSHESAKRALEIAAAGGHNILMFGPPGSGKTILAKAFSTILPPPETEEIIEIIKIHSVAGKINPENPLLIFRPFRSPHHTASNIALIGGGQNPKPGEITLAHRGVLFLDELPEFNRNVLEALRQPLEEGMVTVSRAQGTAVFPAKFILIAAMNPCPCGNLHNQQKNCVCSPGQIIKYQRKISGPLLDRIDIHLEIPGIDSGKLIDDENDGESSNEIAKRVQTARKIQRQRLNSVNLFTNGEMQISEIKKFCRLNEEVKNFLKKTSLELGLSSRAIHRVIKISRTIADLDEKENIEIKHLAEAAQYRPKKQEF